MRVTSGVHEGQANAVCSDSLCGARALSLVNEAVVVVVLKSLAL